MNQKEGHLMKPQNLILRCYGYRTSRNTWAVKCIDLNIAEEEDTLPKAQKALEEAIKGYIETVMDTDDNASIPALLTRKSPIQDRIVYHTLSTLNTIHKFKSKLAFREIIPFHLSGGACC